MQEGEQPKKESIDEPLRDDRSASTLKGAAESPTPDELGVSEGGVVSQQDAAKRLEQALSESGAVQGVTLIKPKTLPENVHKVVTEASDTPPAPAVASEQKPSEPALNRGSAAPTQSTRPAPTPMASASSVPPVPKPFPQAVAPRPVGGTQPELVPLQKKETVPTSPQQGATVPTQPASDDIVQRLRTYKDDAAQAMQRQHASVSSVAAAQARARVGLQPEAPAEDTARTWKNIAVAVITIVLLLGGIGIATWAYLATQDDPATPRAALPRPFFFADADEHFALEGVQPAPFKQTLRSAIDTVGLSLGSIQHIYFTETETLPDGTTVETIAPSTAFLDAIDARVESPFMRALNADFMFGGHVFDGNQPFLVFRTGAYEQAFAGMLAWEGTMSEDLAPIFGPPVAPVQIGTSTPFTTKPFADEVIRNQDARVLRNAEGEIAILYTFPTRSMVILTTNEHTLLEIMTRMANARGL